MALITPTGQPRPIQPGEFKGAGKPNRVSIALDQVAPPSSLYIQRDDVFGFVVNSVGAGDSITFSGRFLRADDGVIVPFIKTIVVAVADRTQVDSLQMGEGYLLGVSCVGVTNAQRGRIYAACFLQRGAASLNPLATPTQVLFADYPTINQPIGWPNGRIISSWEGPGRQVGLSPSAPGAGNEILVTTGNTDSCLIRLVTVSCTLTTNATVANRIPVFRSGGATALSDIAVSPAAVPASTTRRFFLMTGGQSYTDANGDFHLPLPALGNDFMPNNAIFRTLTANLQGGDAWSNVNVIYFDLRLV